MTTNTPHHGRNHHDGAEDFTTGEGLRSLLTRLHAIGPEGWAHDPVAAELMAFVAEKYAALARKHRLDPWEAATAAFETMRTPTARKAHDPWGVITHAVRITCIAEERAQGLLCSVHQARRSHIAAFHDAERFADRENPLTEYHPAFHISDPHDRAEADESDEEQTDGSAQANTSATTAVENTVALFTRLDWPPDTARTSIEHVSAALARAGGRKTAFESLRRDHYARALLDLPAESWMALLRVVLGNPLPGYATTKVGKGVLLRLLLGESLDGLLADDDLRLTIRGAAPKRGGRSR